MFGTIIISFIVLINFFFDISILEIVMNNPQLVIPIMAGYILLGIGYAGIWKWPKYIYSCGKDIQQYFVNFCTTNKLKRDDKAFDEFLASSYYLDKFGVGANKEILAVWIMLWPFTLIWELSHKPFIWVWGITYRAIANNFSKIGTKTAKKYIKFDK